MHTIVLLYDKLNNRVVNLVLSVIYSKWRSGVTTAPRLLYLSGVPLATAPEYVRLAGVQRMVPLVAGDPMKIFEGMHRLPPGHAT